MRSTGCRPARACSSPARSGWSTCSRCRASIDEARELFERLLDLRNDVGLLAEEYDPVCRPPARQLPAGVHPPRARQHGDRARRGPRQAGGRRSRGCLRTTTMRSSSARGRTGSPRRSCWRGPGGTCVLEGADDGRRRLPLRGADAARASSTTSARRSTPLALASPFLRELPLAEHGLELVHPSAPLAHPLDDGTAVVLERSVDGDGGGPRRRRAGLPPAVRAARRATPTSSSREMLGPLRPPRHPLVLARFGAARAALGRRARALALRGRARARAVRRLRAHSMLPLRRPASAAFGLVLALIAHAVGWPVARGGSQRLADALAAHLRSLGGEIETGRAVESLDELAGAGADAARRDAAPARCGSPATACPAGYRRRLARYRYGPGRLQARLGARRPDPVDARRRSRARARCTSAARSRRSPPPRRRSRRASTPSGPFVLLVQPSLFDPTRAPGGQAHRLGLLPRAERLDARHDRRRSRRRSSASRPGFRDLILARSAMDPAEMEGTTPTTSAATSTAASRTCASSSRARSPGWSRTRRRSPGSTSARRRRRRAAASTACAATSRPAPRCGVESCS